jgi:hypothetical protein
VDAALTVMEVIPTLRAGSASGKEYVLCSLVIEFLNAENKATAT